MQADKPSRQRLWQLKQFALNKCSQCGAPSAGKSRCQLCANINREYQRTKYGWLPRKIDPSRD